MHVRVECLLYKIASRSATLLTSLRIAARSIETPKNNQTIENLKMTKFILALFNLTRGIPIIHPRPEQTKRRPENPSAFP
jgi:hypothetical protein